jgi:hypothetical protein
MDKYAACTIICNNYLPFARALASSYKHHNPEGHFFILIVDGDSSSHKELPDIDAEIITVDQLQIENCNSMAFIYTPLEMCTNVKPFLLKYLLTEKNIQKLIYFDPDIYIYSSCNQINELLENYSVVLTPHITQPIKDDKNPSELTFLQSGIFNLGFIAIANNATVFKMLDWWGSRCYFSGFSDHVIGLFVDQKWMNYIPCFCDSLHILKHPGCNVAFWNLHYRILSVKNNQYHVNDIYPLIFFHFSGLQMKEAGKISKFQNRYSLSKREDLRMLFEEYVKILQGYNITEIIKTPYKFDYYSNGKPISLLARRLYYSYQEEFKNSDPFNHEQAFYKWTETLRINGKTVKYETYTAKPILDKKWNAKMLLVIIGNLPRLIGIENYMLLLRCFSFLSLFKNQKYIFPFKKTRYS